jgi:two-component system, OmpR family, sensor histidine kinase KdpD
LDIAFVSGQVKHYFWTLAAVAAVTVLGEVLHPSFDLINIALLYLLPVLISAVRWGLGPSFFASFSGVLAFDYFFVPPVFSFTVNDVRHVVGFVIFLLVALVTGTMATRLRREVKSARDREQRTASLYALSREIAAEPDLQRMLQTLVKTVAETMDGEVTIFMPDPVSGVLAEIIPTTPIKTPIDDKERAVIHWVLEHGRPAGKDTDTLSAAEHLFVPIKTDEGALAVLALRRRAEGLSAERRQLLEALANLTAVAITRIQLTKKAEEAQWLAESEKLHTALLNSISHDLRTPLASITGAVTSLLSEESIYQQETKEILLQTIKEEAQRMNHFVANLLDMVRLESGVVRLNRQWCDIQDILGVALREVKDVLQDRPLRINVPASLPLVRADFALIEHVMINLLENAAKYSPPNSEIAFSALYSDEALLVTVADLSPSIPDTEREHIFSKFYRLHYSKDVSGTGLGLSICKGIVEAHGGKIWVDPSPEYGNRFTFSLPVSEQPPGESGVKEGVEHGV